MTLEERIAHLEDLVDVLIKLVHNHRHSDRPSWNGAAMFNVEDYIALEQMLRDGESMPHYYCSDACREAGGCVYDDGCLNAQIASVDND